MGSCKSHCHSTQHFFFCLSGAARDIYRSEVYLSTAQRAANAGGRGVEADMLWRILAPESMEDEQFSSKSDVWAFGL